MYKILVVEDDTTINQVICEFLKESNYSVTPVYDGAEALRQFEEETFDLVILDMMLPSSFFQLLPHLFYPCLAQFLTNWTFFKFTQI